MGEIHVALLRSIIKDIEDVARTPATGLGMNQYCAANPEGGHLQIVEGVSGVIGFSCCLFSLLLNHFAFGVCQAYSWGFDIRNWQHHLNPLTWPEIFRQLAISAGFGPQLKKQNATWTYTGDNDEVVVTLLQSSISA